MSKKDIIEYFFTPSTALTGRTILLMLAFALLASAVIFITYRLTHTGTAYSAKLAASNVAVCLITTVIMIMISSNIVISLGMVGSLSIIRFRTAIKDPWDTVYIFWSVVEGLCVGSRNFKLALISTLFLAVVLILLSLRTRFFRKYLVVVRSDSSAKPETIKKIIAGRHRHCRLRAANHTGERREMIFEVVAPKGISEELLAQLKETEGVDAVNFLEQSGDTVG